MLVLALGGRNVTVKSGVTRFRANALGRIGETLTEGGVLTRDLDTLRHAAREALVEVLSCRDNHSASGMGARHAGSAIDADAFLPNMATAEFLPSLSRAALEACAGEHAVAVQPRVKDTRAAMLTHFANGTFVYPGARFAPTEAELEARRNPASIFVGADADEQNGANGEEAIEADELDDEQHDKDALTDDTEDAADMDGGEAFGRHLKRQCRRKRHQIEQWLDACHYQARERRASFQSPTVGVSSMNVVHLHDRSLRTMPRSCRPLQIGSALSRTALASGAAERRARAAEIEADIDHACELAALRPETCSSAPERHAPGTFASSAQSTTVLCRRPRSLLQRSEGARTVRTGSPSVALPPAMPAEPLATPPSAGQPKGPAP